MNKTDKVIGKAPGYVPPNTTGEAALPARKDA